MGFVLALLLALQIVSVTSKQLWHAYNADPVAADVRYRNQRIRVQGKIKAISSTYTIYLDGDVGQVEGVTNILRTRELAKASALHVGDAMALECTGSGRVFGEPINLDCVIP
jgi:hypothetical protein